MEILDKKDYQMTFSSDIDESLANAIRRYVSQVSTLAIDEVEIIKNDSALYDETLAHRIGLIPIKTDKISEKLKGALKLNVKKEGFVLSGEMSGNVDLVYSDIPLTHLNKDQELQLNATTKLGTGAEHVKFTPGLMFYRNIQEVTLDKNLAEGIKKVFPNAVIKEKGNKIIVLDNGAQEMSDFCEGLANKEGKDVELADKGGLVITVETYGQMPEKDIFTKAIDVLKKDLLTVSKQIK